MQIEIGTKLKFHDQAPLSVVNIKLNYDYDSVFVYFDNGEFTRDSEIRELLEIGKCAEVFS